MVDKKKQSTLTMTKCYSCGFDFRRATESSPRSSIFVDGLEYQKTMLEALGKDAVVSPKGETYPLTSYFDTLYELMMLLAFGGFGKFIRNQLCRRYKIGLFHVIQPEKYPRIELLNVRERFGLLRVARKVLFEWPDDLMSFKLPDHSHWPFPPLSKLPPSKFSDSY
jgi:hypothetical protein